MFKKILCLLLSSLLLFSVGLFAGCEKEKDPDKEGEGNVKKLAPVSNFIQVDTYNKEAYLKPIWYTREVYNETFEFVGETGSATLMYTPSEIVSVRDYQLQTTYEKDKDFKIEGNVITRLEGSSMPYWDIDEYFCKTPNNPSVGISINPQKVEFSFDEQRYLYYGEKTLITCKQFAITYRHNEEYKGFIPKSQTENAQKLIDKLENGEDINMMVYGDSVAYGCNASCSEMGGNVNPYTPIFSQIVREYIATKYNVTVNFENQAVGGWKASDCYAAWKTRIANKKIDLLIFRIGGNDGATDVSTFKALLQTMTTSFFKDNPNGVILFQSSETPNPQSSWVGNHIYFENSMNEIAEDNDQVLVAPVYSMFESICSTGKKMRDILANNINHPNDFGIRVYAQTDLKVLFGDEFCKEVYVNE